MPRDIRDSQRTLLNGGLYQEVTLAERELRHRSEYDVGEADERRFALLCWALQRSDHGMGINLAGAYRALHQIRTAGEVTEE